jgi:hypothetical protein
VTNHKTRSLPIKDTDDGRPFSGDVPKAGLTTGQEGKEVGGDDVKEGKALPLPPQEKAELEKRFFIRLSADMEHWYAKDTHKDMFVNKFGKHGRELTGYGYFKDKDKLYHTLKGIK